MIDDAENPTTRPNGEQEANVQYDDHSQRLESDQSTNERDELKIAQDRERAIQEVAKRKFANENPGIKKWNDEFLHYWENYFQNHLLVKGAGAINALYSVEAFDEYVGLTKERLKKELGFSDEESQNNPAKQKEFNKKLSEKIEREIVLKISEIYRSVDHEHPDETFEEITTANFMNSVRTSFDMINQRMTLLNSKLEDLEKRGKLPENLKGITFYEKISENQEKEVERKTKKGIKVSSYSTRPYPLPIQEPTTASEFLHYIEAQTKHYMNIRKYLHNATVIFKRGKGQHGFYEQLAEYAKQLSNSDLDSMMLLPDAKLFMTAHNLYLKHLEAHFAKLSWVHQPDIFSTDFFAINTDVEKKVLADLKKLFPDVEKIEEWRLQRALKMGVQIARAVTLSEAEIAAYADAVVQEGETPKDVTFESYYIGDSDALVAFDPAKNLERFLPPDLANGPLFYSLVSGFEKDRIWDHRILWERMKKFQQSYQEGRGFIGLGKDEELLIEAIQNFSKIGAIEYRSGWRYERGYESWLVEKPGKTGAYDYLESWKQIENIGFLILKNFASTYIFHDSKFPDEFISRNLGFGREFLEGNTPEAKAERRAFFEYLNDHYINFDPLTERVIGTLDSEITEARKLLGKNSEEIDIYKFLLNKALYGVIRNRLPSYFIKLERDRYAVDGQRAYEKIRRNIDGEWTDKRIDIALRNLGDVEARLRLKTSERMMGLLEEQEKNGQKRNLYDSSIQYFVTEEFIREELPGILSVDSNAEEVEDVIKLFRHINENYLANNTDFAKEKINMIHKGKYPYTLALEEFDRSFVAYRAPGDRALYRAINDTANVEQKVSEPLGKWAEALRQVAIDPKRDITQITEILSEMRKTLSVLHGERTAWKQVGKLVGATINFFRKDSVGKAFWGVMGVGRANSIATEMIGTHLGVWEWENSDIHHFIVECEKQRIIPKNAQELRVAPNIIEETNPLLKLFRKYKKVEHKIDTSITTGTGYRKMFGAKYSDIIKEYAWRYLPIVYLFLLYSLIKKAAKDQTSREG